MFFHAKQECLLTAAAKAGRTSSGLQAALIRLTLALPRSKDTM